MPIITGYIQDRDSGVGINGVSVDLRFADGITPLGSATTTNDPFGKPGFYSFTLNEYPGDTYVTATVGGTTIVRHGRVTGQVGDIFMSDIPVLFSEAIADGFGVRNTNSFLVTPGSGLSVNVAPGTYIIHGHPFVRNTSMTLGVPGNTTGEMRTDHVVAHLFRSGAESGYMDIFYLSDTPGFVPNQDEDSWQIPIARIELPNGAGAIQASYITDLRIGAGLSTPAASIGTAQLQDGSVTTAKIQDGAVSTAKIQNGSVTAEKLAISLSSDYGVVPYSGAYLGPLSHTGGTISTTNTVSTTAVFFSPFITQRNCTIDWLGFAQSNTANTNVKMGIWASGADGFATGAPLRTITMATGSTAGLKGQMVTPLPITPGRYWLGIICQANINLVGIASPTISLIAQIAADITGTTVFTYGGYAFNSPYDNPLPTNPTFDPARKTSPALSVWARVQ